jgi:hypothetical protein
MEVDIGTMATFPTWGRDIIEGARTVDHIPIWDGVFPYPRFT